MVARILTGLVLAPLAFFLVALGPLWGIHLLFVVLAMIGAREFMNIVGDSEDPHFRSDSLAEWDSLVPRWGDRSGWKRMGPSVSCQHTDARIARAALE